MSDASVAWLCDRPGTAGPGLQESDHVSPGTATSRLLHDAGAGFATARLSLRRFTPDDLPLLVRLNGDTEVMRHLGGPMTPEATRAMLENRILRYYEEHPGLGVWATIDRASRAFIGFHLLNHIQGETLIQVGYRLLPSHWGCGYATEMTRALVGYGFRTLGLKKIVANAAHDNHASQRVLLKSGLKRNGERAFSHPAYASFGLMPHFEREAADWLAEAMPATLSTCSSEN